MDRAMQGQFLLPESESFFFGKRERFALTKRQRDDLYRHQGR